MNKLPIETDLEPEIPYLNKTKSYLGKHVRGKTWKNYSKSCRNDLFFRKCLEAKTLTLSLPVGRSIDEAKKTWQAKILKESVRLLNRKVISPCENDYFAVTTIGQKGVEGIKA